MKKISRRDFLKVTGLMGAAAALTACGGSASSTAASTASSAAGSAAASTAALGADTQAIVDRGVLKVGVKNAVKGFSFQDTLTGEYKGFPALEARSWHFTGTPILLRSFAVPVQRMCTVVGLSLIHILAMTGLLVRIRPPRGPRRVLWVVVVTTSA